MSLEVIAIISAGIAPAGLILNGEKGLRREMQRQREETRAEFNSLREGIGELRERMAHLAREFHVLGFFITNQCYISP